MIARSVPEGQAATASVYVRHYPRGRACSGNPIGYSFVDAGRRSSFERFHNDELVGNKTEFLSILDELRGHARRATTCVINLDPAAQRGGRRTDLEPAGCGAVVAIDPSTRRGQGDGSSIPVRPQPRSRTNFVES